MTTWDRLWAIFTAALCAVNVGLYAGTGSPFNAGVAAFTSLVFFAMVIGGQR